MEQGTMVWAVVVVLVGMAVETAWGHGMMLTPTQRSSLWRYPDQYSGVQTNYDDNQLFCGGFQRQWEDNNGKCGTCGDPYDDSEPRDNEAGGRYGKGIIAETYTQGQLIDVTIRITANHQGYFLFKLCPHNANTAITQECLDQNLLKTVVPNTGNLTDKYYIGSFLGDKDIQVQLPSDVTCTQCVLQWTYNTGNSWGCADGTCCVGCGQQENFVNCADIAITACNDTGTTTTTAATDAPATTDDPTTTTTTTTDAPATTNDPTTTTTTTTTDAPATTNDPTTTTTTTAAAAEPPTPSTTSSLQSGTTNQPTTATTTTTTAATTTTGSQCTAVGAYALVPGMDWWCDVNCAAGFCPSSHCTCA